MERHEVSVWESWDSISACIALAAVLLLAAVSWAYQRYIGRPRGILRRLRAQGVPGYPFRMYLGQIPEILEVESRREKDPGYAAATGGIHFWTLSSERFGRAWTFALGSTVCLSVTDPDLVRQILVNQSSTVRKQEFVRRGLRILGNGLLLADGKHWERQRRLINPSFSVREIKRLIPLMSSCAEEATAKWGQSLASAATSGVLKSEAQNQLLMMNAELASLTMDIVFRSVFGTQVERVLSPERMRALQGALSEHFPAGIKVEQLSFVLPFYRCLPTRLNRTLSRSRSVIEAELRRVVGSRMEEHKCRGEEQAGGEVSCPRDGCDLLGLMLDATLGVEGPGGADAAPGAGLPATKPGAPEEKGTGCPSKRTGDKKEDPAMSLKQLMDECATFFAAGSESTANLLTWTMYLLSQHLEWQEKAREEVMGLCKGGAWAPSPEELNELKVLSCILWEVLRLMPSAPITTRTCPEDIRLSQDLVVPKGCDLYIVIEGMHRDKGLWGEDADKFRPERFANGVTRAALHPGAFIPFGTGPRSCIGQNFAVAEAKIILGSILRKFSWRVADSYVHHPEALVTMQAKHGLPVHLFPLSGGQDSASTSTNVTDPCFNNNSDLPNRSA